MAVITKEQKDNCREYLLKHLQPGDTVYTILKHVSKSGMSRVISLYVIKDNKPINISFRAAPLLEGYNTRYEGCKAGGCGMDMGFHLVYTLGRVLYPDGYPCYGAKCIDSSHYREADTLYHDDGGYAFQHQWLR